MRGGQFLFPLYVDPEDAAAADAPESLHPVTSNPVAVGESFNQQRLATLIRSSTTNRFGSLGQTTEITADVLNSLPKWTQAVLQTGCFNGSAMPSPRSKLKRSSELQSESDFGKPRKKRSFSSGVDRECLTDDESGELQAGLDELNIALAVDPEMEDEEELPTVFTQAEVTADSVEKYAELLERLVEMATDRQQAIGLEPNDVDVFQSEEVKVLRQSLKAMEKNDWINKLEPELLISLMSSFDTQPLISKRFTTKSKTFTASLKYLCYLAQILSTLPYEVEDEPLHIIYLINRYVSLRLGFFLFSPVLDDLKAIFVEAGVPPTVLEDDESDLSTVKIDKYRLRRVDDSMLGLHTNGRTAFAIAVMLHLKFTLKRNYQLDNEKCATYKPSATDAPLEAKERSPKKLLLPSVDDLCQPDDPIQLNWNLFLIAWYAAREDQKQLDIGLEEVQKATPKRRRRSCKSAPSKKQKLPENDSEDEYVELLD
ncbi:hypothetical protein JG688_00000008 [Phytophthora aleatoria]|uniref:Sister chromatid cohesion protein n=1 Tax=Phytophthora aleatoria TaxID=2496075 RepID=A0A8J5J434_9STRA|nr:hypothetical protein JG688_00000008 [Phytophthora aleatoria]